jgi:hypothetical protein
VKPLKIALIGAIGVILALLLGLLLAWTSAGTPLDDPEGFPAGLPALMDSAVTGRWLPLTGFVLVGCLILGGGWWLLTRHEDLPARLLKLLVAAALLRLLAGGIWYVVLPRHGYGSPSESLGYIMSDAHKRDQAAWKLAKSDQSLLRAYDRYQRADQYGGMLLLSAALYRGIGGSQHSPLGMVALTAAFSALAIPFAWAFAKRGWQEKNGDLATRIAWLAAWLLALYPETVLQGSTQMREAFLLALATMAFYGLALYRGHHSWVGPAWILGALLLTLFFSPPAAGLLLLAILGIALVWGGFFDQKLRHKPLFWLGLALIAVVVLIGSFYALERLSHQSFSNPLEMLGWWIKKTAAYQAYLTERASGWVQKIFRTTPEWTHTPLLVIYGSIQPFLPAAIADLSGTALWRGIAIWRSLGWTLLLTMLLYGGLRAWISPQRDRLARALSVVIWAAILFTAFRAGGDPWDNVRYRITFAGLQAALAAWAWFDYRKSGDPWLRRVLILVLSMLAWFMPFYLRRYTPLYWPIKNLFVTLGLGLATAAVVLLFDWLNQRRRKK